jgi:hypothetical protein
MNMTSTFDRINGGFGRLRVLIRFDHEDLLMRVNESCSHHTHYEHAGSPADRWICNGPVPIKQS